MTSYDTESDLIEGLMRKDEQAFRDAIRQYHPSMISLARSLTGHAIADEVVQESWFSVLKALPKFEGRSTFKTWVLRIVANEAKTRLRKENRQTSLEAMTGDDPEMAGRFDQNGFWIDQPIGWDADSPDELLSSGELKECMERLLTTLPEQQCATLNLREQQGYSLAEICNILEVSESNVRVLLHRARTRMFKCVEHFQDTGECCVD
ncbi:MAG: RNA polymerase sigma factor [Pseudomonadales bacterium]